MESSLAFVRAAGATPNETHDFKEDNIPLLNSDLPIDLSIITVTRPTRKRLPSKKPALLDLCQIAHHLESNVNVSTNPHTFIPVTTSSSILGETITPVVTSTTTSGPPLNINPIHPGTLSSCSSQQLTNSFMNNSESINCLFCPLAFRRSHQVVQHIRKDHTSSLEPQSVPLHCPLPNCQLKSFEFQRKMDLWAHHFSNHIQGHQHLCTDCGKGFKHLCSLNRHRGAVHVGLKPFPCLLCNRRFNEKGALQKHDMWMHQKIRPYLCKVCGERFVHPRELRKHKLNVSHGNVFFV